MISTYKLLQIYRDAVLEGKTVEANSIMAEIGQLVAWVRQGVPQWALFGDLCRYFTPEAIHRYMQKQRNQYHPIMISTIQTIDIAEDDARDELYYRVEEHRSAR